MIRILLLLVPIALIGFIFLYFNAKQKVQMMQKSLYEKDSRIYDLEREVAELNRTIQGYLRKN